MRIFAAGRNVRLLSKWFSRRQFGFGIRHAHIGEQLLELPEVLAGGGVDDGGLAAAGAVDLLDAESVPLEPTTDLRSGQSDIETVAGVVFHGGRAADTFCTLQFALCICNGQPARLQIAK